MWKTKIKMRQMLVTRGRFDLLFAVLESLILQRIAVFIVLLVSLPL